MTIKDLSKDNKTSGVSLFFSNTNYDFMAHYNSNIDIIDRYMVAKYGNLHPLDESIYSVWRSLNDSVLVLNAQNYQRMFDALSAEYNPIENYDRYEDTTRDNTTGAQTITQNGNSTNKIAPYDSATFNNDSQVDSNSTANTGERNDNEIVNSHIHGNIGVTTNAQMINGELELRKFNLLEKIFADVMEFSSIFVDSGLELI